MKFSRFLFIRFFAICASSRAKLLFVALSDCIVLVIDTVIERNPDRNLSSFQRDWTVFSNADLMERLALEGQLVQWKYPWKYSTGRSKQKRQRSSRNWLTIDIIPEISNFPSGTRCHNNINWPRKVERGWLCFPRASIIPYREIQEKRKRFFSRARRFLLNYSRGCSD